LDYRVVAVHEGRIVEVAASSDDLAVPA